MTAAGRRPRPIVLVVLDGFGIGRTREADAIAAAVEGAVTASQPGSAIQLHPHTTVIVDRAAASKLAFLDYYRHAWANKPDWQGI